MIDIKKFLAAVETRYNLHSHTQFCDGRFTMAEFAAEAVRLGFKLYGFTPHSPVPIASPCNMDAARVPEFFEEVQRLNSLYRDSGCRFAAGMEIDYLSPGWGPSAPYFADLPLDYRIGSVHFIPDRRGEPVDIDGRFDSFRRRMADHFANDIRYVVETFFAQSAEMVVRGGFDILGHADKIAGNAAQWQPGIEDEGWYVDHVGSFIRLVADSGVVVEVNTKARDTLGRFFPSERWLPILIEAGTTLAVNSDAHYIDKINASRPEALALIKSLGYGK